MLGWLYVVGFLVALIVVNWDVVGADLGYALSRETLYGVLLAIGWPLLIVFLAGGHGAPPMALWARWIVVPIALAWIVLGWWTIVSAVRYWVRRRRATGVQ
jgi:hypothetical protein